MSESLTGLEIHGIPDSFRYGYRFTGLARNFQKIQGKVFLQRTVIVR
jgi:hypothetical protein